MSKLDPFIVERQAWADYYKEHFKDIPWLIPQKVSDYATQHAWQAFVCYVDPDTAPMSRNDMMDILQQKGIATRPGTHAVHMLSFYKEKYDISADDFPGARDCDQYTMAIPLHNKMTKEDFDYVIESIKRI